MGIQHCELCNKIIVGEGVCFEGKYYHKKCMVCAYCGKKVTSSVVSYKGKLYHPECNPKSGQLVCAYCRKKITSSYVTLAGKNYHHDCYDLHVAKRCAVCGKPIGPNPFYKDWWGSFAHVSHNGKSTELCYSCGRFVTGTYKRLGTNEVICKVCSASSVTTSTQVESCRARVISVFRSSGISGIPENIPIELKKKDEMGGKEGFIRYAKSSKGKCSNFRIAITSGLPELHFQGVLAHEMLHSWLALYGREVTEDECEGFCNLGCAFVYNSAHSEFGKYLLERMYENADTVYGDGYRLQKERYEKLGWTGLLESLKKK